MDASLTVTFSGGVVTEIVRDSLILKQEDWEGSVGKVKMSDFYNFAYNILSSYTVENNTDCGLNSDGSCTLTIYAYPSVPDLEYQLHTSYGSLSDRSIDNFEHQELITFNIAKEAVLSYFPHGSVESSWVGAVYGSTGNVRSQPPITIDESGAITIPEKVYGTLKVTYTTRRHEYTLTAEPRDDSSDLFGAVVYGVYTNGIAWVEIEPPPDADELSQGSASCGGLPGSLDVDDDGDDGTGGGSGSSPPSAPKVDRTITYDYCTQEVQSDVTTYS